MENHLPITFYGAAYVNSLVYTDKPANFGASEVNIQATIDAIRPDLLEIIMKNCTDRMEVIFEKLMS